MDELSATLASLDTDHQDLIVGLGVDHVGVNECLHEVAAILSESQSNFEFSDLIFFNL